jgi:interferon, gamma-inducible protein 30
MILSLACITLYFWLKFAEIVVANEPVFTPVKVELYMETLCPYCARFVKDQLGSMFQDKVEKVVDVELIPWVCPNFCWLHATAHNSI